MDCISENTVDVMCHSKRSSLQNIISENNYELISSISSIALKPKYKSMSHKETYSISGKANFVKGLSFLKILKQFSDTFIKFRTSNNSITDCLLI